MKSLVVVFLVSNAPILLIFPVQYFVSVHIARMDLFFKVSLLDKQWDLKVHFFWSSWRCFEVGIIHIIILEVKKQRPGRAKGLAVVTMVSGLPLWSRAHSNAPGLRLWPSLGGSVICPVFQSFFHCCPQQTRPTFPVLWQGLVVGLQSVAAKKGSQRPPLVIVGCPDILRSCPACGKGPLPLLDDRAGSHMVCWLWI